MFFVGHQQVVFGFICVANSLTGCPVNRVLLGTHRLQWRNPNLDVLVAPAPALADALEPQLDVEGQVVVDVEELATEEEEDRVLLEGARKLLREEATSLVHELRHKPKNPYCDTCRRAKLRLVRKFVALSRGTPAIGASTLLGVTSSQWRRWEKVLDGSADAFIVLDVFSGFARCISSPE